MVDVAYEFLKDIIEHEEYLKLIMDRYNISNEDYERIKEIPNVPYNLMIAIGESKNIVKRGNEVDLEKVSKTIIQDLRKNNRECNLKCNIKNENTDKISRSNINWYPGHMFKTKREIKEILRKY